jgi:uncharacterized membrane protein
MENNMTKAQKREANKLKPKRTTKEEDWQWIIIIFALLIITLALVLFGDLSNPYQ